PCGLLASAPQGCGAAARCASAADASRWCRPQPCGGGPRSLRGVYTFTIPQRDPRRHRGPPCRAGRPIPRVAKPPQGRVSAYGAIRHDVRALGGHRKAVSLRPVLSMSPTMRITPAKRLVTTILKMGYWCISAIVTIVDITTIDAIDDIIATPILLPASIATLSVRSLLCLISSYAWRQRLWHVSTRSRPVLSSRHVGACIEVPFSCEYSTRAVPPWRWR